MTMYLETKRRELQENVATLQMLGLARDVGPFLALIQERRSLEAVPVLGGTAAQRAEVVEVLEATAAQYLASVGMTLAGAIAAEEAGLDVAASAARVVSGGAEFRDLVAVSESVVLGTVQDVRRETEPVQFTASILPTRAVPPADGTIVFSGALPGAVESGQQCVFFLSRSLARFRSARRGDAAVADEVAQQFEPYCLIGGSYVSLNHHHEGRVSAAEVSRALEARRHASAGR